jgi:hypothetical protein
MITRLGVTVAGNTNSEVIGQGTSQIQALGNDISSTLADWVAYLKYGTVPNAPAIVPYPASPSTVEQGTVAGAWTPEDSAAQGLLDSQTNQTALITNAISSGSYDPTGNYLTSSLGLNNIPWTTFAIIGGCILGAILLFPLLERGR